MTITQPIIVIVGPTAAGKSALAAAVAHAVNGEIISADSRQVYRRLDIGTNKSGSINPATGLREIDGIPQHLIDIIEPNEPFSAGAFVTRATAAIAEIRSRGKQPVIAGGTGLYIKALIDGLAPMPAPDEALRAELRKALEERGVEHLYQRLRTLDPVAAEKNRANPQRLIRAIEVCTLSGKSIASLHRETVPSGESYIQFGLRWKREELYGMIDRRAHAMITAGLIEEAGAVVAQGFAPDCPGIAATIGYTHALACAAGTIPRNELEEKLARDTRHYAKRQLTWFNRDPRITWLETSEKSFAPHSLAARIIRSQ